ncbi:MAG: 1-acyl-sn-glycerol-3-phosphate acyltransferase [Deltaproteobacteria bacterium]
MPPSLPPPYRPNPLLRTLYRRFFNQIQVDSDWVAQVRSLAERGTVVYILRNLNFVDFFALDYLTKQFELPRIRFASDLGLWVLNPMGRGWLNAIFPRKDRTPADELGAALSPGGSAVLFLKRPPSVLDVAAGASGGRGMKEGDELVQALIALQRQRSEPILLVPQLFLWTKLPDTRGTRLLDLVLGPREWASPVRTIGQFLYNYRHVELKAGEPVNLAEFLRTYQDASDTALISRLTYTMMRRLERERRSVTGPALKSPERVRQEILRSPRFRTEVSKLTRNGKTDAELMEQSLSMLRAMQATPEGTTRSVLAVALERLFRRIYAGIDIDREGIARIRAETKEKSLVLLPSHKSHIDYLIISYAFNEANLPLPLIAAGDNLTFFPLGPIFRRAGAFFIRRSFAGDALYPIVVDAYIRRLIREGYPLEMFLEGGRSRTGKLLAPKFGLLKMVVSAALAVSQRPVCFVPVSIGYERVVDSYDVELGGGEKTKEDARGLLGSAGILSSRYGRINLQFGQILTLEHVRSDLGLPSGPLSPAKQRALVTRLGNRVMDEINRVTAVTPGALTALALLSYHRRGQPHEKLLVRCERLLATLRGLGARTTPGLTTPSGELRPDAIREAAQMFADGELLLVRYPAEVGSKKRNKPRAGRGAIYTIPEDKRLKLDGSKNIIIHFFVERALVALALLLPGSDRTDIEARARVQELSRLFKYEFRFRADASFDTIFEETVAGMVADGDLERQERYLTAGQGRSGWSGHQWLMTYAGLLRNFVESYRVAARGLAGLEKGPLDSKDLVKQTLATGRLMYLSGEVERAEAISKPLLENAFAAFQDLGYVNHAAGQMQLPNTPDTEQASGHAGRCLEESIAKYLDREAPA